MKDKFVFLGDSLVFGYGVKKSECWVSKYKEISSLEVINKGVNGSTTTDMLDRLYDDVILFNPSKVFIMGGTNDLLSNRTVTSIIDNIEVMIKDLLSNDMSIVIGLPPTIISADAQRLFIPSLTYDFCEESLPILRDELLRLCHKYNCLFIDFYSVTKLHISDNIFTDGIHLNEKGQDLLFEEAKKVLFND